MKRGATEMRGAATRQGSRRMNQLVMYLGTTFWIAWNVHLLVLWPASSVALAHPAAPWDQAALIVGYALGACALAVTSCSLGGRVALPRVVVVLALGCAMLAVLFYVGAPLAPWTHTGLLVLLGCCTLVITVLWMCVVCVRSGDTIYRAMGGTMTCGALLALGAAALQEWGLGTALLMAMMLASFACFVFATESTLGADANLTPVGKDSASARQWVVPPVALAAGAVVWGVIGCGVALFTRALPTLGGMGYLGSLAVGIAGAALAFLAVGHRLRKADRLGAAVLALMVSLLGSGLYMLQALPPFPVELAAGLVAAGCALFHLYGKVLYLDISLQTGASPLAVFAQGSVANYLGALAGAALACLLPEAAVAEPGRSVAVLGLILVLLAANALFFSRKSMGTRWGLVARQLASPLNPQASDLERFSTAALLVAQRAGFTPREAEVFQLLMQGHRAKQIEEKLGISLGTVRNHLNRGYAKLGVHSYDEARALVQEACES